MVEALFWTGCCLTLRRHRSVKSFIITSPGWTSSNVNLGRSKPLKGLQLQHSEKINKIISKNSFATIYNTQTTEREQK
jgi:hypothetical protein